jgi:hypothetical protein
MLALATSHNCQWKLFLLGKSIKFPEILGIFSSKQLRIMYDLNSARKWGKNSSDKQISTFLKFYLSSSNNGLHHTHLHLERRQTAIMTFRAISNHWIQLSFHSIRKLTFLEDNWSAWIVFDSVGADHATETLWPTRRALFKLIKLWNRGFVCVGVAIKVRLTEFWTSRLLFVK